MFSQAQPESHGGEPLLEACTGIVAGKKAKIKWIPMMTLCGGELKEFKN